MISYNISGSTLLYELDCQYNYRLRSNYVPNPLVCYKLSGIKTNVAVSLHRLENLEKRYQGDNVSVIKNLSDSVYNLQTLSIYISDNQYNITNAKTLREKAHSSIFNLQNIFDKKGESLDFKDEDDIVVNIAMTMAIFASFSSVVDLINPGSNAFAIGKISSGIAVSSTLVAFLKFCLKESSSPSNQIYYSSENMNNIALLFGEVEEYNASDGIS